MKRLFSFTYIVLLVTCIFFLTYLNFYDERENVRQHRYVETLSQWDSYSVFYTDAFSCVSGEVAIENLRENVLAFYTSHQDVSVYMGSEMIYRYPVRENEYLAKTPGYAWHFVTLPQGENKIRIIISSPYPSYKTKIPVFYLGNYMSLSSKIISNDSWSIFICVVIFFLGVSMIAFWIGSRRRSVNSNNMLYLGIFAILMSTWSMNESKLFILITENNIMSSYLSFIALMFIPIPFVQFIKSFYASTSKVWDGYCILSVIQIATCLILQAFQIKDLRETLWATHVMIILLAIIVIVHSIILIKTRKDNKLIMVHVFCVILYAGSLFLDIIAFYYGMWDNNFFGRIGLLLYVVIVGIFAIRESTGLMKLGLQTQFYEKIAYTDQMTGLGNRAAFMRDMDAIEENPQDTAIINFDVNHLKRTNDTYSHVAGDLYIREVSKLISKVFCDIGSCYRIGGDEFEVVLKNGTYVNIPKYLEQLDQLLLQAEWEGKKDWMKISHGYAEYDPQKDHSIMDTYKRADGLMYEDKALKKANESKSEQ